MFSERLRLSVRGSLISFFLVGSDMLCMPCMGGVREGGRVERAELGEEEKEGDGWRGAASGPHISASDPLLFAPFY